jgi:putative transposase
MTLLPAQEERRCAGGQRKYGGTQLDEMKKMKALEEENRRLRKLVEDLSLDKQALQDLVSRKW